MENIIESTATIATQAKTIFLFIVVMTLTAICGLHFLLGYTGLLIAIALLTIISWTALTVVATLWIDRSGKKSQAQGMKDGGTLVVEVVKAMSDQGKQVKSVADVFSASLKSQHYLASNAPLALPANTNAQFGADQWINHIEGL